MRAETDAGFRTSSSRRLSHLGLYASGDGSPLKRDKMEYEAAPEEPYG
jgi:hypothetical protein